MLDLQECNEATELLQRRNEACCLCFSRVTSCRLELDGAVLSIWAGKARRSAGTKKAAFLTPTWSAWRSHVQLTQAQHALPCPIVIPVLALILAWYRIFLSNHNLLPLILRLELTSFSSGRWLQIVAQIPAGEVWQAFSTGGTARLACCCFPVFFSKPLKWYG